MPEKNASRKLRWKGFKGRVSDSITIDPIIEMIGDDPLCTLPRSSAADFIKAKNDKGSKVYRAFLDLGHGEEEVFIKTFSQKQTWQIMMQRMRERPHQKKPHHYLVKLAKLLYQPALAKRCWKMSAICQKAGLPVAEPLLYMSRRKRGFREEVLAVKGVNPRSAPDARQHFMSFFSAPPDKNTLQKKRETLSILGRTIRTIRRSSVMLPDLKLHNMVLREPPGEKPSFVLVDLSEAFRKKGPYPETTLLERFSIHVLRLPCFTGTDQVRLVKAYLEAENDPRPWREICRQIYERARQQGRSPG
ncbi:MAG: hypothetical protein R6V10_05265 [bacterium]